MKNEDESGSIVWRSQSDKHHFPWSAPYYIRAVLFYAFYIFEIKKKQWSHICDHNDHIFHVSFDALLLLLLIFYGIRRIIMWQSINQYFTSSLSVSIALIFHFDFLVFIFNDHSRSLLSITIYLYYNRFVFI